MNCPTAIKPTNFMLAILIFAATPCWLFGDANPVIIACPLDQTIDCSFNPEPSGTGNPIATTDCAFSPNLETNRFDVVTDGACPQAFTIDRTWTVSDQCGNSASCQHTIAVEDHTPPTLDAHPPDITLDANDPLPEKPELGANDNCNQTAILTTLDHRVLHLVGDALDLDDGDPVATWPDLSPSGNDVAQSITSSQPTFIQNGFNGHAVVRFDGTSDYLETLTFANTPSTEWSIFIVSKTLTVGFDSVFWWNSNPGGRVQAHIPWGNAIVTWDVGGFSTPLNRVTASGLDTTQAAIWNFTAKAGSSPNGLQEIWRNGVLAASDDDAPTIIAAFELEIGRVLSNTSQEWNGEIAEMIVYDKLLTEAERLSVTAYLQTKYFSEVEIDCEENTESGPNGCITIITRTWTATDLCGNQSAATQTITVVDTTSPMFNTLPESLVVDCSGAQPTPDGSGASGRHPASGSGSHADDCPAPLPTMIQPVPLVEATDTYDPEVDIHFMEIQMGECPGVIARTWTATDDCGNTAELIQLIVLKKACVNHWAYWLMHPEEWLTPFGPVTEFELGCPGGLTSAVDALAILQGFRNDGRDPTFGLARELIAATLNIGQGAEDTCGFEAVQEARDFLCTVPIGSHPTGPFRRAAENLRKTLRDYNQGLCCAPRCPRPDSGSGGSAPPHF